MKFWDMPYERVDFDGVGREVEGLGRRLGEAGSGEEQFAVHRDFYELSARVETMMTLAEIRHDIDVEDEFYDRERAYYDEKGPLYRNMVVEYQRKLFASPYRDYLEGKIGRVAFKNIELGLKAFDERLIPLMQEENALTTRYDKVIAGAKIDWEGETLNLSLLQLHMRDRDRRVRERAWKKYEEFFAENGDELDELYDRLVKNRTAQARMLGYDNYLILGYYRMNRNCYDREMVENFRRQIKEDFVPFVSGFQEKRRKRLGVERLSCADDKVYFEQGNPLPVGTPEEILAAGLRLYREMSPETAEFMNFMMENQLFDVLGRKTKKAGGYMTYLPMYNAPFVFANFNGTSGDVDVITHECGHAFQGYVAGKDPVREHADITMETAEIHSMSMEFFAERWGELFFGERAEDYRAMHLEDSAQFIPYGCMVDEFQHIVYENPEMTPGERKAAWMRLEGEYRPHLDYEGYPYFESGGFWQKQQHIYVSPLYYIDYCLAQVCALQHKVWMDEDEKGAWESYLKLCGLSASDFFTGLLGQVGLSSPFEDGTVRGLVEKLQGRL